MNESHLNLVKAWVILYESDTDKKIEGDKIKDVHRAACIILDSLQNMKELKSVKHWTQVTRKDYQNVWGKQRNDLIRY